MADTDIPEKFFAKALVWSAFPAAYLLSASFEGYPLVDGKTVKLLSPKNIKFNMAVRTWTFLNIEICEAEFKIYC